MSDLWGIPGDDHLTSVTMFGFVSGVIHMQNPAAPRGVVPRPTGIKGYAMAKTGYIRNVRRLGALRRLAIAATAAAAIATMMVATPAGSATAGESHRGGTGHTGPSVVKTDNGYVRGTVTSDYRSFQDIPFGKAPVGALRWKAPQSPASWSGVRDATAAGPACLQGGRTGSTSSEDCLNLNVWTPASAKAGEKLPVAVWIFGGAFRSGSAAGFQPVQMANQGNMIVVTINYRLGALGNLTLSQLDAADHTASGNYGLQDQIKALQWVKTNINRFGGNSRQVTIAGQSAGGESVCTLLASPWASGLFQRAIVESGLTCIEAARGDAQSDDAAFPTAIGCTQASSSAVASCLRGKSSAEVLAAQSAVGKTWYPTTQTPVLPLQAPVAFAEGKFNRVPVLIGSTGDEGASFVYSATDATGNPLTAEQYQAAAQVTFGSSAPDVLAHYPLSSFNVPGAADAQIKTDVGFSCPALSNAASLTRYVPTYVYEFRDATAASNIDGGPVHASELPYLWGTSGTAKLTTTQQALSHDMIAYWSTFAKTARMAPRGLPSLTRYSASQPREVAFNADGPAIVSNEAQNHQCGYWDPIFAKTGFPFHINLGVAQRHPANDAPQHPWRR